MLTRTTPDGVIVALVEAADSVPHGRPMTEDSTLDAEWLSEKGFWQVLPGKLGEKIEKGRRDVRSANEALAEGGWGGRIRT